MRRRTLLASATLGGGAALLSEITMSSPASANAFESLKSLKPSPRMPVLFLGHGSPMNAIEDNEFRRSWQAMGPQFGTHWPRPQAILCISAHWLTRGWWLTAMDKPRTIHDFGGFPQELFDQQYPAPGAPALAGELNGVLRQPPVGLDVGQWGLDHGTWSVLKPMFPAADIPVVQLSMDYGRAPAEHFALGQQVAGLRERGVLIVGSGNIVHNLRAVYRQATPYDWAIEFDKVIGDQLQAGDYAGLAGFQKLGKVAELAHPTWDHYLPLLYAAGAARAGESMKFFNQGITAASISMRSVIWG